ncbi:MAG: hypothetical protein ACP5XB_07200 [Isosphaeraceae bacterium]
MAMGDVRATRLSRGVDAWLELLKSLVADVKAWAEAAGWETRLTGRDVNEKGFVRYEVPVLVLDRDGAEVSLVPVARKVLGADGLVDFYLMPDFDDVASLYREEGQWFFHYAFHPDPMETDSVIETERFPLDEASLNHVLNDIAAHAQALQRPV